MPGLCGLPMRALERKPIEPWTWPDAIRDEGIAPPMWRPGNTCRLRTESIYPKETT